MLHCCNNVCFLHCTIKLLNQNHLRRQSPSTLNFIHRSLRARLLTLLLLVAQISSLLIVPLHAVAHGQATLTAAAEISVSNAAGNLFSNLFGHEQGLGCNDWSAAFALDCHSGHCTPALPAVLPTTTLVVGSFPAQSPASPFRQFLARAPPRI